ncbi:helix-turn-helix domain-containing protein [Yoonia sp. SDW83-1]|uniref:helix-turn-helix domain-containing protein n=1 Tax=Yoonia sp. SDW83-1 TaxID=3366945 RepID=UPI00398C5F15
MPKSARLSGIKSLYCYTIPEAAGVTGVSDRTIRAWIKQGLTAMTSKRPTLVRGDALIIFI